MVKWQKCSLYFVGQTENDLVWALHFKQLNGRHGFNILERHTQRDGSDTVLQRHPVRVPCVLRQGFTLPYLAGKSYTLELKIFIEYIKINKNL